MISRRHASQEQDVIHSNIYTKQLPIIMSCIHAS